MPKYNIITDTHKKCNCCQTFKLRSDFYNDINRVHGLSVYCKDCTNSHRWKPMPKHIADMQSEQICTDCGETKPASEFYIKILASGSVHIRGYCKACVLKQSREWSRTNRDKVNIGRRKTQYGLSPADIDAMKIAQKGMCPICQEVPKRLVIDHSHITGAVRGLLCDNCNKGLGFLKDNAMSFYRALTYLGLPGGL